MSVNMGLQLFPPPPSKNKASRKFRHARPPQPPPASAAAQRARSPEVSDGRQSAMSGRMSPRDGRQSALDSHAPFNSNIGAEGPRSHTSFSDAPTLVRSHSVSSHRSIAKPRFAETPSNGGPSSGQPIIRSIFPRYNPEIPLERQPYYPSQASPSHIPRDIISRAPYSPGIDSAMGSPMSAPPTVGRFPRGIQDVPKTPNPATTEELKDLWKVTNGWRVSASEGRTFCLKMKSSVDMPIHTLCSSTQPFYTLSLDPTSTSALLSMTRQDPYKSAKGSSSPKASGSLKGPGLEVLTTTLEESSRRLPPNDGLVALLCPVAATNMAMDLASKPNPPDEDIIVEAAERECGRLVWDDDSKQYYLVHPAMSTPFKFVISSSPAWSRVEYTLEHPELPLNLVKLTRDGSGGGFLEIDTTVAARINCFYIVDVAICAIILVAVAEEKAKNVERFDAPPTVNTFPMSPKSTKNVKIQEMEIDLESQNSFADKKEKSSLPAPTKGVLSILFLAFKFIVWVLTVVVNTAAALIICVSGCLTSKP